MAMIRTGCCLNLPPPANKTARQVSPCAKTERSWKRQCGLWVGVACSTVVGLEVMMSLQHTGNYGYGNEKEEAYGVRTTAEYVSNSKGGVVSGWSDEGACLPWRQNSLETVVPEKLPRPTARRRWEAVRFSKDALPPSPPAAAGIAILHSKSSSSCFLM